MAAKFDFRSLGRPLEADWPVLVRTPIDGGQVEESTFMARFKMLTKEQTTEILANDKDGKDIYRAYFIGLGKAEGEELTPELLEQLIEPPYMRFALGLAYGEFCQGIASKNSVAPPAS